MIPQCHIPLIENENLKEIHLFKYLFRKLNLSINKNGGQMSLLRGSIGEFWLSASTSAAADDNALS